MFAMGVSDGHLKGPPIDVWIDLSEPIQAQNQIIIKGVQNPHLDDSCPRS